MNTKVRAVSPVRAHVRTCSLTRRAHVRNLCARVQAGKFIDASQKDTDSWDSVVAQNVEVPCRYDKEPPAVGSPRLA